MILKKGSKGEDVKKLQAKLGLSADGIFGAGTEAKLKEWQMKNGLAADGIAGPATLTKLGVIGGTTTPKQVVKEDVIIPKGGPIDLSRLKGHVPDAVITQIPTVMEKFQINTPLRLAHFLAQCGHESGNFRAVQENLNYSADGLKRIFPK
jgi:peptidoglycan hydrolase-like protein with peptidoglycan-binding domain